VLIGFALEVKGGERRGPREQETTMPKHLLPDECSPREVKGVRP